MPIVPPCGLACRIGKVHDFLKEKKKPFLLISIFLVLIIEIISIFLSKKQNYACYWYPMLSQVCLFLIFFSIFLWNEKLRFCFRKNIAVLLLSIYYFFGSIALLFKFSHLYYYEVASVIILIASIVVLVLSLFKKI